MADAAAARPAFSTYHPVVPAVFVALTLALTMFSMQPVLIALSFAGGFTYGCAVRGLRRTLVALRWQLPLIAIVAVLNPLFSASGSTELFRLGGRAVYFESLVYGACMGGLFMAAVLWFEAVASMLSYDKVMALFGNAAPVLALMISMCMRLIPQFVRRGRSIFAVQDAVDVPGRSRGDAVHERLRASSVLMGWSMEDSLERADAMRARGWGVGRRTTYTRYRFRRVDAAALAAIVAGGVLIVAIAVQATGQFTFYPRLSTPVMWWGYVAYAAWMFVPCVLWACDERRFG